MSNYKEIDTDIKNALSNSLSNVIIPDTMLIRIESNIENREFAKRNLIFKENGSKRALAFLLSCVLIIGGFSLIYSPDVRAIAANTIANIKLFIVKDTDGNYKTVESNSAYESCMPGVALSTQLSDKEISQKVGYNVVLPNNIYGDLKLDNKSIAIGLSEKVSYDTFKEIQEKMQNAINDDNIFNELKEYNPHREAGAHYKDINKNISICIGIDKESDFDKSNNFAKSENLLGKVTKVKVGDIGGEWVDIPYGHYSDGTQGIVLNTPEKQPKNIETINVLIWKTKGLAYILIPAKPNMLTSDEAVKIANSFIEFQ